MEALEGLSYFDGWELREATHEDEREAEYRVDCKEEGVLCLVCLVLKQGMSSGRLKMFDGETVAFIHATGGC